MPTDNTPQERREEIARIVREAIENAQDSAIPEPWEVAAFHSQRAADQILALPAQPPADDVVERAAHEAYRMGYQDGFVDALHPGGYDGDERELYADIDNTAVTEGWLNIRDTVLRNTHPGADHG